MEDASLYISDVSNLHTRQTTRRIRTKGFTLIELMIVVAIIGILAALAIPGYNDFVTRSQVVEGVELMGGLKSPIGEYAWQQKAWPTRLVPVGGAVVSTEINAQLTGKYVRVADTLSGTYPAGVMTASMTTGQAQGKAVELATTDGGARWICRSGTSTGVDSKWLPQACR